MARRSRLLSPQVLDEALRQVVEASSTPPVAVGGYAMQHYGSDRLISDLDVIVQEDLPFPVLLSLTFGGVTVEVGGVPVDLIRRSDHYEDLYDAAVAAAVPVPGVDGAAMASPEHMVALKLAAGPREAKVLPDLWHLLSTPGLVDYDAARELVRTFMGEYGADVLDGLREEALWRRDRGDPKRRPRK